MNEKGFTLIEIIITLVILGIIAVFSFAFFGSLTKTYGTMGAKSKAHLEAAYVLERISRELRDAKLVIVSSNTVDFEKANSTPQDNNAYVRYCLSGTNLYRQSSNDNFPTGCSGNLIAKNVTNFTVSPDGTHTDNQIITVTINITQDSESQSYSVDVYPKNYPGDFSGKNFGGNYAEKIY